MVAPLAVTVAPIPGMEFKTLALATGESRVIVGSPAAGTRAKAEAGTSAFAMPGPSHANPKPSV